MSVDHPRNDHFRPVLLSIGRGVDGRTYLFDQSITDKNLAVPDNAVCDSVDLAGSDQDSRGLPGRRTGKEGGYASQK